MYFVVGFKSFDITSSNGTAETWYDWMERSRNSIRRSTLNRITMEWILSCMREPSKVHGNFVRRWNRGDIFSETSDQETLTGLADV